MSGEIRNAVARVEPKSVQVTKSYAEQFAEVLPDHVPAKAFIGAALGALRKDAELLKAAENSPTALIVALTHCATLGHQPGGREFYLTPRWNSKTSRTEILGIEGYRGVIERMYRSGAVACVVVREVCEGDSFEFVEGVHDKPIHQVDWFADRGPMVGVYAYATLTTGAVSRVVILSRADVERIRARSDLGKKDKGPWVSDERAMWWKTAAHRLEPWVPTSAEYRREVLRAQAAAGAEESTLPQFTADPVTGEVDAVEVEAVE